MRQQIQTAPPQVEDRLRALDQLRAKGLVSPEEYSAKRKQILDSL
ncbi:MAG: SHOCT domain-containing protein [Rhodospirillaceae bacterium]|nr:SHOCT domain-containing protein [Rhodospirillaceae bacterium]